ncbi:MAG: ATP synthase F1 subunit delta [Candidatus Omnitrophica bacterium]|nr:ATP synthase F1 subunit delta [Candidatus Omnitrophota bacterium]
MSYRIAQRYAQALFDLSQERSNLTAVHHDLRKISDLVNRSADLKHFLADPVIAMEKSQAVLQEMFHGKIDALTFKFLLFLGQKNRLGHLPSICAIFSDLYEHAKGILRTKWTSSVELSAKDVDDLSGYLKKKFNKDVIAEQQVDPGSLGGIKVQAGDTVYDYTLRTQLKRFRETVRNAS